MGIAAAFDRHELTDGNRCDADEPTALDGAAATLLRRFGPQLAAVLAAHRTPAEFIDAELPEMDQVRLARTASRSVVGIMNEFNHLADAWRHDEPDLLTLAVRLAATPSARWTSGTSVPTVSSPPSLLPGLAIPAEPPCTPSPPRRQRMCAVRVQKV